MRVRVQESAKIGKQTSFLMNTFILTSSPARAPPITPLPIHAPALVNKATGGVERAASNKVPVNPAIASVHDADRPARV